MLCRLLTHFSHLFISSRSWAEPHSMNLHCMFSPKEGCCTWLSAFLPVSCRVQSQGEKLCRITCKFDRGGKKEPQETIPQLSWMDLQLLEMGLVISLAKAQFWRGPSPHFTGKYGWWLTMSLRQWHKVT